MEEDNFQDHFRTYKGRSSLQFIQKPTFHIYVLLAVSFLLIGIFLIVALSKASELSSDLDELMAEVPKPKYGLDFVLFPCGPNNTQWQYFNGKCYYFSPEKCTWNEAKQRCVQRRSQLVVIDNMAEQYYLQTKTRNERFWIGFTDQGTEGRWRWVDGRHNSFTYWKVGEPNNDDRGEDCAHLWGNGEWNDVYCTYPCYYICEKPLPGTRPAS